MRKPRCTVSALFALYIMCYNSLQKGRTAAWLLSGGEEAVRTIWTGTGMHLPETGITDRGPNHLDEEQRVYSFEPCWISQQEVYMKNRKKALCMILCAAMLSVLTACGGTGTTGSAAAPAETSGAENTAAAAMAGTNETEAVSAAGTGADQAVAGWPRNGYYTDENEHLVSVTWMEDMGDEPGWYVGCVLGEDWTEDSWAGILPLEGDTLHGTLPASGSKEDITVTVSEEGDKGLLLVVEGGETYHLTEMEIPDATIFVTINTEGMGNIVYAEGEEAPEIDPEFPAQSAQINLAEPATHTILAYPQAGNFFVKWTKNGEDFSTEPQITVLLDESADYVAVFEEDPDWQNPVMNFVGPYQCDQLHASVECFGNDEAWITIEEPGEGEEVTRWIVVGRLDTETQTISYTGATKSNLVLDGEDEIKSEDQVYTDGTGTVVFHDGGFTWHEDEAGSEADREFVWAANAEE